jgi:hypothetical protein
MKQKIVLMLAFVTATILLSMIVISVIEIAKTESTINVDSNDPYEIRNFNLPDNTKIIGSFTINSLGNRTIHFWVNSPDGKVIFQPINANETARFDFITKNSGYHTFVFDNEYEFQTSKSISFSFTTQSGFLGIYTTLPLWLTIPFAFFLILTVIIYVWQKNKLK